MVPSDVLGNEGGEVIAFVFILLQHHLEQGVEGLVFTLVAYPFTPLVLHEIRMRFLTRLVYVIGTLFQTESPHGAEEEKCEPQRIHIQLEWVEVLVLRVPDESEELRRAVLDGGEVN